MAFLSRKNRIKLVKLLALLSIVRWPNVLFTGVAQYTAAFFVFNSDVGWVEVIKDSKLHFIVFATAFILAAGFIINSFYDMEKDLINRPHKTLFDRVVSKSFCLNTYLIFNLIGLSLSLMGSKRILVFFLIYSFGLWFYSHKLQKIPLVRELSASLLSVAAFFSLGFHYEHVNHVMIIYGLIFMQLLFIRELIKDFRHVEGDRVAGNQTILMVLGVSKSKVLYLSTLVIAVATMLIFAKVTYTLQVAAYLSFSIALMLSASVFLFYGKTQGLKWAHWIWKLLLGWSIVYLIFFRITV